jgi:hypothetical protein
MDSELPYTGEFKEIAYDEKHEFGPYTYRLIIFGSGEIHCRELITGPRMGFESTSEYVKFGCKKGDTYFKFLPKPAY